MNNKIKKWILYILLFSIILIIISTISLLIGSVYVPVKNIINSIFFNTYDNYSLIINNRLHRIILATGIGGSLSLAGALLQAMFRNPLVEPYTLGISGGASLGVCLNLIFKIYLFFGFISIPISGFFGSLMVILFLFYFSLNKGKIKIQNTLLIGVMISFISSSLIMLLMSISKIEDINSIIFWTMGYLDENNKLLIFLSIIISLITLIISLIFSVDINTLNFGETNAYHLGINVEKIKILILLLSSILTGFSVSVAGVIGFVGLIVPHIVRIIVGNDSRILLICSYLGGAIFLILSDTIARTIISPQELPVGVITGIIGGSIFIFAISKRDKYE